MRAALFVVAAAAAPAAGQVMTDSRMEMGGRVLSMGREEQVRIMDIVALIRTGNRSELARRLAVAEGSVTSDDARYALAILQLEAGRRLEDDALRRRGLDLLIGHRLTPAERLPLYLGQRGDIALRAGDAAAASALWTRQVELQPDEPQALVNLAQARQALGDADGAGDLLRRAIAARQTEPAPEAWYRQWVSIAFNGRLGEQIGDAARALVAAYPTPDNWRFALVAWLQLAAPQPAAEIELLQLMRAAGAFARPDEYQRLAQLLLHSGRVAEGRAVLEDGIARGVVDRDRPPVPEILAEMDRAAAGEGAPPAPAPATPSPLSPAAELALAGRRGEAEAAFRAVAAGPGTEADIAGFWLVWLGRSSGSASAERNGE